MRPTTHKLKRATKSLECLGDFVRRIRNEKGLSLTDVSRQSALFGLAISGSYINRIERNPKLRVTLDRLIALAHGLGIPVDELLAHAVSKMSRDERDELGLVTRFRELSSQRKSDVWTIIQLWHSEDASKESRDARPSESISNNAKSRL
ncbi:MAG TPA: helix-turn-helix transcriptional regulator [Pyrinomonadaceae bacterium]|nr:helix-turn-helix transcriptional regulator [Pyrinomonadaceae bacterium]